MASTKKNRRHYGPTTIDEIVQMPPLKETTESERLFDLAAACRKARQMTNDLTYEFCYWKSKRSAHRAHQNSNEFTTTVFSHCLGADDDLLKLHILTALKGVNIPTASAILMFLDKKKYGVRRQLKLAIVVLLRVLNHKPRGYNFRLADWETYVDILRRYALKYNQSVREIEFKLFTLHKEKFRITRHSK